MFMGTEREGNERVVTFGTGCHGTHPPAYWHRLTSIVLADYQQSIAGSQVEVCPLEIDLLGQKAHRLWLTGLWPQCIPPGLGLEIRGGLEGLR